MAVRPYDLYVRFLITKGVASYQEVNALLTEISLPTITSDDYDRQYTTVQDNIAKPVSDQITTGKHEGPFLRWMGVLQVRELWTIEKRYQTPETLKLRLLYDIHNDPILRLAIHALITKQCKAEDIAQDINVKFSYMLTAEHITIYRKFFWNPEIMTRRSWRDYLSRVDGQEKTTLFMALSGPLDELKTFLDMPSKVDVSGGLQSLLVSSYGKAKHYLKLNTAEAGKEARAWISTALSVAEKYQKYSRADVGDFAKSLQMEFDYVQTDFVTPDEELLKELRSKNEPKGEDNGQES